MATPAGIEREFPLARLTTIGTGGAARWFARPASMDELATVLRFAADQDAPVAVVGLGSNLLVADAGFDGLVLRLDGALARIELEGELATCGGGASLAAVVRRATDAALTGIEFGCAIPGTVGGAVRMNAGAYGGELKDVLAEATVVSAAGVRRGGPAELELSYRHSNVVRGEVVAEATLRLAPGVREVIRETVREMQARRSSSQPRKARTFGSVFKNPDEGRGAGALIGACGLKGHRVGGAQISEVHANFIENAGEATSADVAALIGEARAAVRERFGVELRHEVELLGPIEIP
jgi:UDP-N-acetylmuramate dehydrogenase